ncbi:MAG: hypothetical protein ACREA0_13195, partial [bacterium]
RLVVCERCSARVSAGSLGCLQMPHVARFVARIASIRDRPQTLHRVGVPGGPQEYLPFPDVVLLVPHGSGVMLYRYMKDGTFSGDTWHESIQHAHDQARFEYGDAVGPWHAVPAHDRDPVAYAITFANARAAT